ncbi:MAG: DUF805 domain-containing protein [Hyphomonadaceae bacterium JAD_PAG50586_4]|nr:MAG: DUF805 domain-containing protein [Hyphomonadaceae bacterium JAD_PAG50586_4]
MNWVRFLFSFKGRINRLQALLGLYGFGVLCMLAPILLTLILGQTGGGILLASAFGALFMVSFAFMVVSQIAIAVRRAHDVGLSGWAVIWWFALVCALVAAKQIWPSIEASWLGLVLIAPTALAAFSLFVVPGQPLAHRFGDPPRAGWLP